MDIFEARNNKVQPKEKNNTRLFNFKQSKEKKEAHENNVPSKATSAKKREATKEENKARVKATCKLILCDEDGIGTEYLGFVHFGSTGGLIPADLLAEK